MSFKDIKHNLFRTLSANGLDGAIPIVDTFLEDHVREIGYQKVISEREFAQRQHFGKEDECQKMDEKVVVAEVVNAVRGKVLIRHDGLRTIGTLYLLKV